MYSFILEEIRDEYIQSLTLDNADDLCDTDGAVALCIGIFCSWSVENSLFYDWNWNSGGNRFKIRFHTKQLYKTPKQQIFV